RRIACENWHGPRATPALGAHTNPEAVLENAASSIVNPARLTPWLADNICMPCHQTGQARVLQPGKDYGDFRPGALLDDTLSIFLVPFERTPSQATPTRQPPQDDLLEHYLSMRLSKCYRGSAGQLGCLSCHDPHVQPAEEEVPRYFRAKCLACHTESSCKVPLAARQAQSPPDNCIGCHMPKRNLKVISHSALTNHRIVAAADEPFPDAAFHMTTPALPDLVHLNAK